MTSTHPKFDMALVPEGWERRIQRWKLETRIVTTVVVQDAKGDPRGMGCSILSPGDKDSYNLGVAIATGRAVKDWWKRDNQPILTRSSAVKLSFRDHAPPGSPDALSFAPVG